MLENSQSYIYRSIFGCLIDVIVLIVNVARVSWWSIQLKLFRGKFGVNLRRTTITHYADLISNIQRTYLKSKIAKEFT